MNIKINERAYHMANACRDENSYNGVFRYVYLREDGAVLGTDGYIVSLVREGWSILHRDLEEPTPKGLFLQPEGKVPTNAKDITLTITHTGGKVDLSAWLSFVKGREQVRIAASVRTTDELTYSNVDRIIPTECDGAYPDGEVRLNVAYAAKIMKAYNYTQKNESDYGKSYWKYNSKGNLFVLQADDSNVTAIVAGLRRN